MWVGTEECRDAGSPIVLTAPLTESESVDDAGFFIHMSLASIAGWMEWVIDKKCPTWRDVPTHVDGRAGTCACWHPTAPT